MSEELSVWNDHRFSRIYRFKSVARSVSYVLDKTFNASPSITQSKSLLAHVGVRRYRKKIHELYCTTYLEAYEERTGLPASDATLPVLVLFGLLIRTFDDEFENLRTPMSTAELPEILAAPSIVRIWAILSEYLSGFACENEVTGHLRSFFDENYDCYRILAADASSFPVILRAAEYDSGMTVRTMYDLIRLFNGHCGHPKCAGEFYASGIAGKFVDDLADIAEDVPRGDPNLFYSLLLQNPDERAIADAAIRSQCPLTLHWWRQHCPYTTQAYFRCALFYYDQVECPALRLPLDLYLGLLTSRAFSRTRRRNTRVH